VPTGVLTISPSIAVTGQEVTITGSNFTPNARISAITSGGTTVSYVTDPPALISEVVIDSNGNFNTSFLIRYSIATKTAGEYKIIVTDTSLATGEVLVTQPEVVLNISPDCSSPLAPGESIWDAMAQEGADHPAAISVSGTGFHANKPGSIQIRTFLNGSLGFPSPSFSSNQYGAITTYFIMPWMGSNFIPSTNTVQAIVGNAGGGAWGEATHSIPGPQSENC
jgi:hypothetical protein